MNFYLGIFGCKVCPNNTLLQPKEKNKAGDILGVTEKTSTDKKRDRRHKKTVKRVKIKEKEKRQKLKEASATGENRKQSKAEVTENLKKLTKGGKAKILKVGGFSHVVSFHLVLLRYFYFNSTFGFYAYSNSLHERKYCSHLLVNH